MIYSLTLSLTITMRNGIKNEDYKRLINSSPKWKKVRDAKIKANPLCEICGEKLSEEVHHIKPLLDYSNNVQLMEDLAYNPENLQALCRNCHYEIHRKLKAERYRNKDKNKEKINQETEDFISRFLD